MAPGPARRARQTQMATGSPGLLDAMRTWESSRIEPHEFIEAGEHVAVPWTLRATGRDGIEVRARVTWTFTIRDGAIQRICMYQERQEALETLGLSEKTLRPTPEPAGYCAGDVAGERGDHQGRNRRLQPRGLGRCFTRTPAPGAELDFSRAVGPFSRALDFFIKLPFLGGFLAQYWESVSIGAGHESIEAAGHVIAVADDHARRRGREGVEGGGCRHTCARSATEQSQRGSSCTRSARKPSKPWGCRSRRCRRRTWSSRAEAWRRSTGATWRLLALLRSGRRCVRERDRRPDAGVFRGHEAGCVSALAGSRRCGRGPKVEARRHRRRARRWSCGSHDVGWSGSER